MTGPYHSITQFIADNFSRETDGCEDAGSALDFSKVFAIPRELVGLKVTDDVRDFHMLHVMKRVEAIEAYPKHFFKHPDEQTSLATARWFQLQQLSKPILADVTFAAVDADFRYRQ